MYVVFRSFSAEHEDAYEHDEYQTLDTFEKAKNVFNTWENSPITDAAGVAKIVRATEPQWVEDENGLTRYVVQGRPANGEDDVVIIDAPSAEAAKKCFALEVLEADRNHVEGDDYFIVMCQPLNHLITKKFTAKADPRKYLVIGRRDGGDEESRIVVAHSAKEANATFALHILDMTASAEEGEDYHILECNLLSYKNASALNPNKL